LDLDVETYLSQQAARERQAEEERQIQEQQRQRSALL